MGLWKRFWAKIGRRLGDVAAGQPLDSAAHVGRNAAHWANAQDAFADEFASEQARGTARARCRQEYLNAGYIRNAVRSFKTHVVGITS